MKLLGHLIREYHLKPSSYILDAACGAGDALLYMKNSGFCNVLGIDGSDGMLEKAKTRLCNVNLECIPWSQISQSSILSDNSIDFCMIISNSLSHADKNEIPGIIKNIYKRLSRGGILVLDTRSWINNEHGVLIEPGRLENIKKFKTLVNIKGEYWKVFDHCAYDDNFQWITYTLEKKLATTKSMNEFTVPVRYSKITASEISETCQDSGFKDVKVVQKEYWPYTLIQSVKPRG